MSFAIRQGFAEADKPRAAALFWQAFEGKLGRILGPRDKALVFLATVLQPQFAISAYGPDDTLLGLAGFKTAQGGLVAGDFADLRRVYGLWGAAWRGPLLELFERPLAQDQLLMDGIFVSAQARGQGLGGALIDAVLAHANDRGCSEVRLDVIDSNLRARALYERKGFVPRGSISAGVLRPVLGFSRATTMVAEVQQENDPAAQASAQ